MLYSFHICVKVFRNAILLSFKYSEDLYCVKNVFSVIYAMDIIYVFPIIYATQYATLTYPIISFNAFNILFLLARILFYADSFGDYFATI